MDRPALDPEGGRLTTANQGWPETLEAKRLACESRLLPVMEQMNPKIMLVMQQMTRYPESAELLNMITSDPDLPLAQAVQVLLNATSQEQTTDVDSRTELD